MVGRTLGWGFILIVVFFSGLRPALLARADDTFLKRHVMTETHGDGSQTLVVIDENMSLRDDPTVLSQRVVFKRKFSPAEKGSFLATRSRYEASRAFSADQLRLPLRGKPLWISDKDQWSAEDENSYSEWVANKVRSDFLQGTGLLADCADVGLIFRWVYARDHRLPIANTLSGSGKLFGNFTGSDAWDKLPTHNDWRRDERFKAAMRELFDQTYTWTIQGDQYPVEVSREYIRPGVMFMIIRQSGGHTQTVHSISNQGGVSVYWGNEPSAERIYSSGLSLEFPRGRGFQRWRNVRRSVIDGKETWKLIRAADMAGYSREQLETGHTSGSEWLSWVLARLGYAVSDQRRYAIFGRSFEQALDYRRSIIGIGSIHCSPDSPCPSAGSDYENYSTFSRDTRLRDLRNEMRALSEQLGEGNSAVVSVKQSLIARGEIVPGSGVTFYDALKQDGLMEKWSADPNVSPLARWGISDGVSPSGRYSAIADAFLEALRHREGLVRSAYSLCHYWKCQGTEASVRALETKRLDPKYVTAFAKLQELGAEAGVEESARAAVRSRYRAVELRYFKSSQCAESNRCTADDVIFGEGAAERLPRWSAMPKDEISARWGL